MDARARLRLDNDEVAWLTTVDGDGQPQMSPVWFVWHDDALHVASEPAAGKVRNIAVHQRVALHLEGAGEGDLVITVEGIATAGSVPAAPYADAFARVDTTAADYLARFSLGLRITPTRWRIFGSE